MTGSGIDPAGRAREDADVETSSEAYAGRFSGKVGAWFLEVQARHTLDLLRPWPRARVLDLGGGHGQLVGPLVEAGYQVTVLGSAAGCGERIWRWRDSGSVRFLAGDLLEAPFAGGAFDVVLAFRLLPHVRRWAHLVAELCRLARRAVVLDYPTQRSVNAVSGRLFTLKQRVERNTRPFRVFSEDEIAGAGRAGGFRVTGRRPQFAFPMALHRALGNAPLSRFLEAGAARVGLTRVLGSPVVLRLEPR